MTLDAVIKALDGKAPKKVIVVLAEGSSMWWLDTVRRRHAAILAWRWRFRGPHRRLLPAALWRPRLGPAAPRSATRLSGVEVRRSDAPTALRLSRVGVRRCATALFFDLPAAAAQPRPPPARHSAHANPAQVIVDITTARPDVKNLRYRRHLYTDRYRHQQDGRHRTTPSRVSYNIPGQQRSLRGAAACAMPRTAPPRCSRTTFDPAWRRFS